MKIKLYCIITLFTILLFPLGAKASPLGSFAKSFFDGERRGFFLGVKGGIAEFNSTDDTDPVIPDLNYYHPIASGKLGYFLSDRLGIYVEGQVAKKHQRGYNTAYNLESIGIVFFTDIMFKPYIYTEYHTILYGDDAKLGGRGVGIGIGIPIYRQCTLDASLSYFNKRVGYYKLPFFNALREEYYVGERTDRIITLGISLWLY